MPRSRSSKFVFVEAMLLACALACGLAESAGAQKERGEDGDLLERVKRMERVAAQKLEAGIVQALRNADRPATRPDKAAAGLKQALEDLDNDSLLEPARRATLKRLVKDRLHRLDAGPKTNLPEAGESAFAADRANAPKVKKQQKETIAERMRRIRDLQVEGKAAEAKKLAEETARDFPDELVAGAAKKRAANLELILGNNDARRDRDRQVGGAFRDIDRSATPGIDDMEFPKDWAEKTKGRTNTIALTDKEKALIKALNTQITVNWHNTKLDDVIKELSSKLGVAILLDKEALKDAEASYDSPIVLSVKNVSARTILRKVLGELGMTYIIKDELIQATSHQAARRAMVVRRYYIGDLVNVMGGLEAGLPLSTTALNQHQAVKATQSQQIANQIMDMIKSSVDPDSWQGSGGLGSIIYHAPSMSLVVKQSAEIHARMAGAGFK